MSKYVIVYTDECRFNSSSLSLLSWMKKGQAYDKVIRWKTENIAQLLHNRAFMFTSWYKVKHQMKKTYYNLFIFWYKIKFIINKNQLETRTVFLIDNARIHQTEKL